VLGEPGDLDEGDLTEGGRDELGRSLARGMVLVTSASAAISPVRINRSRRPTAWRRPF
jgi:hypothetical protein